MKHRMIALAFVCLAATGYSKTLVVNNSPSNTSAACKGAAYPTIGSAIAAADPGDTVQVCPGLYPEAVYINIPNLKLVGIGSNNSDQILLLPTVGVTASDPMPVEEQFEPADESVLEVDSVSGVEINNITVSGAELAPTCLTNVNGIFFRNASGTVENSSSAFNGEALSNGCSESQPDGFGVLIENGTGAAKSVTVTGTSVHDFGEIGILAIGANTTLTAEQNAVADTSPLVPTAAGFASISAGYGAKATITNNVLAGNGGNLEIGEYVGVYLYEAASGSVINSNTISNSTFGIEVGGTNDATVRNNNVSDTVGAVGIEIYGNNEDVQDNTVTNSGEFTGAPAIYNCGSHNHIACNLINEAGYGVYTDASSGNGCSSSDNSIGNNTFHNVGTNQYWYSGSESAVQPNALQSRKPVIPARPLFNRNKGK